MNVEIRDLYQSVDFFICYPEVESLAEPIGHWFGWSRDSLPQGFLVSAF